MPRGQLITHARLREVLHYCQITGLWVWKIRPINVPPGQFAGSVDTSRNRTNIWVDNNKYRGARLAWFWMTGKWPKEIDHIDHNNLNDSWRNLRDITHQQNTCYRRKFSNNTSGSKGVHFHKRDLKWYVQVGSKGRKLHIGVFHHDQKEAAIAAYNEAARRLHGKFAFLNPG